ncbi:hypothetical protein [Streptomyces sp. E5N91]|uniref:hypothetical protein n=1 Tax=Streptomyces sp. E5N91 TaxID=1851996 RepID=UPI000EF60C03|nr:hypothetical protein [Streptomyces sp. E5N91]
MYVLVPDDPVFFAKFQSLEEPLLRHLYRLHRGGQDSVDERIIADAYDSWVQVLLRLPLWSDWHTGRSTDPAPDEPPGYVLYGTRGDQLTSLYPIEVTAVELGQLTACLDLFAACDGARPAMLGQARAETGAEQPERDRGLADVFRRVLEVLLLPPPQRLLAMLREVTLPEPAGSVTLPAEQETEYRRFCEDIVTILSSGDTFAYDSHRAMYL